MTKKQIIEHVKKYISGRGYMLTDTLAEHICLSLQSRAFVMLMGRTDAPQTLFIKLFAQAIGASEENGRFRILQVKPDWMDFSDLFGYVRLNGEFEPGAMIDFVKAAQDDPDKPYILCLERVLLDRAEYYLNDILRPIEARGEEGYEPQPLLTEKYYGADTAAAEKYGTICMPENLYIVCTLNLDETSLPLNQRFLDRIYTMELTREDLVSNGSETVTEPVISDNSFLKPAYLRLSQCQERQSLIEACFGELETMNRMLMKGSAYVGYQIRNDAVVYVLNNARDDLLTQRQAMDQQILQKVLPRVQGSMKSVGPVLRELAGFCANRYPRSAHKITGMIEKGEREGYTSCWL